MLVNYHYSRKSAKDTILIILNMAVSFNDMTTSIMSNLSTLSYKQTCEVYIREQVLSKAFPWNSGAHHSQLNPVVLYIQSMHRPVIMSQFR